MSDIIHILPDTVANQIAAGEVIQRPASIVKELVENSIDAGASRIQVVVTDAGKTCIQVIDNGKGMSETDARRSFERHATSKIRQATDLFALTTMGFRGEALASIAAVTQVELRTRQATDELGTCITIEGCNITNQEPISCNVGANFIVKNIFYNIPARRKFLKSDKTELTNIIAEFERIALAHPDISFRLSSPSATILDLPAGTYRQRVVNVFGKSIDKHLLSVNSESPVVKISGFVGSPESSKKKGAQQFFFVNGRFMRHPYFAKAVLTAYDRLIPDGEQPPFFLMLEVDPAKIDVNIHPTKTEIKFEDEQTIWQILLASVRETLGRFNAIPTIDFNSEDKLEIPSFYNPPSKVQNPEIHINPNYNPFEDNHSSKAPSYSEIDQKNEGAYSGERSYFDIDTASRGNTVQSSFDEVSLKTPSYTSIKNRASDSPLWQSVETNEASESFLDCDVDHTDLFLFQGRYIVTPAENGLYIIDAHRAHCRILYEEYLQHAHDQQALSQGLLFPQLLDLNAAQALFLESMMESVELLGFSLSPLGNNTYSILAVPDGTAGLNPSELLLHVIENAMMQTTNVQDDLLRSAALSVARRSAIPVGQHLTADEMRNILRQLFGCSSPHLTPDGKRIISIISNEYIDSQF